VAHDLEVRLRAALGADYRLGRKIGHGGFGEVYLARDLKLDRDVAVKTLRAEVGVGDSVERFRREAKAVAKLRHPAIMPVYQVGEVDGLTFMIMPYVAGGSLRNRLEAEGQLSVDEALRITSDLATALQAAHDEGLVHRDIKPENILFEAKDTAVVLTDFGISKTLDAVQDTLTQTGETLGTPTYASPEQLAGDSQIDARADQYSLACVLFEMLTGDPPFQASTRQAVIAKHIAEPAPSARTVRPDLSETVDTALRRALSKAPADRFGSIAALRDALNHGGALRHAGPAAHTGLRAGIVITVLLAAAFLIVKATSNGAARSLDGISIIPTRQVTFEGDVESQYRPAVSPDGEFIAYFGSNSLLDNRELRLQRANSTVATSMRAGEVPFRLSDQVAWSPNGGELFFPSVEGIRVLDVRSRESRDLRIPDSSSGGSWTLSPTGDSLVTVTVQPLGTDSLTVRVALWDSDTGEPAGLPYADAVPRPMPVPANYARDVFSDIRLTWAGSDLYLTVSNEGGGSRIFEIPVPLGTVAEIGATGTPVEDPMWLAENAFLVIASDQFAVLSLDRDSTRLTPVPGQVEGIPSRFAATDLGAIAYTSFSRRERRIWVAPTENGVIAHERGQPITASGYWAASPSFSPSGDSIAYLFEGVLRVASVDGTGVRDVWGEPSLEYFARPDDAQWISSRKIRFRAPVGAGTEGRRAYLVIDLDTGARDRAVESAVDKDWQRAARLGG